MNGIDRVFVSALNTVKRLPSTPDSPKPPLDDRLLLYGLFKQSVEGDIPQSMLLSLNEEPVDDEEDANREKTEAWAKQKGTSKTEAKKLYITTLIRSMRQHGSKTETAISLLDELEFVWNQVNGNHGSPSTTYSQSGTGSPGRTGAGEEEDQEEEEEDDMARAPPIAYRTAPPSPSKALQPLRNGDERVRLTPSEALLGIGQSGPRSYVAGNDEKWKAQVEQALQQIRAELASVRESLLPKSPSASSALFGPFNPRQSILSQLIARLHRLLNILGTVALYDIILLLSVWYIFHRRGDPRAARVEEWVRNLVSWIARKVRMRMRTGVKSTGERR